MDGVDAITLTVAELERDPHEIYRQYRPRTPLIRREDGSYIAIRARDVEQLITDPRTRQMETDSLRVRGVTSGALYDFFAHSMLFTNGPAHRRRRAPLSRAFAVQLVTLILAGSDTSRAAMTMQVSLLLQHRKQWEALCRNAALISGAVAEALRYEPSVGSVPRFTLVDIGIDGADDTSCSAAVRTAAWVRHWRKRSSRKGWRFSPRACRRCRSSASRPGCSATAASGG